LIDAQIARDGEYPSGDRTAGRIEPLRLAPDDQQGLLRQFIGQLCRHAAVHEIAFHTRREIEKQRAETLPVASRRHGQKKLGILAGWRHCIA